MEGLPTKTIELLREFQNSPYFTAYKEYVLLQGGKCLAMLRSEKQDRDTDMYYKGMLRGAESLILDLVQDKLTLGEVEKANHDNREHTQNLLEKDLDNQKE